ncbi:unnamed protein product, partial [Brenthis ino]
MKIRKHRKWCMSLSHLLSIPFFQLQITLILGVIFIIPDALASRDVNVESIFKDYNIVPDIVSVAPENVLNVFYSSAEICPGDEIVQTQSIMMPSLTFESQSKENYTLIMIGLTNDGTAEALNDSEFEFSGDGSDADVPSQQTPALRSVLYWLIINIPGNNIKAGFTVTPYVPPVVYPGSGYHRFVFLLYEQRKYIDESDSALLNLAVKRSRFRVSHFASEYGMKKLEAGNIFTMKMAAPKEEFYCKA